MVGKVQLDSEDVGHTCYHMNNVLFPQDCKVYISWKCWHFLSVHYCLTLATFVKSLSTVANLKWIWSSSLEEFNRNATASMEEWDTLERYKKSGPPAFTQYFRTHKLDDMRTKMAAFDWPWIGKTLDWETSHVSKTCLSQWMTWWKIGQSSFPRTWTDSLSTYMTLCSCLTKKNWHGFSCPTNGRSATSFSNTYWQRVMRRWPQKSERLSLKRLAK